MLLAAVVVPPAVTLVWLGIAFAARERDSLAQRARERQEAALQAATHSMAMSLADAERGLTEGTLPRGVSRLTMTDAGLVANPAESLLWTPGLRAPEATAEQFREAEADEYRGRPEAALRTYERLARTARPETRAGALLRLARVHRTAARWPDALAAYDRMLPLAKVVVDGAPADLQARRAICDILGMMGRDAAQRGCAALLGRDLAGGRWRDTVDRATWESAAADATRWSGRDLPVDPNLRALSEVASAVAGDPPTFAADKSSGWRHVAISVGIAHVYADRSTRRALAVSPDAFADWVRHAEDAAGRAGTIAILGSRGESLFGMVAPLAANLSVGPSESGLPWTVTLDLAHAKDDIPGQRRLLTIGLAAILLLLCGSTYFLWRTLSRELQVARLQTEFVAAVSHEFRTPLTSIRHVAELLEESDALSAAERRAFYSSLTRNAQRLERFVESLLEFARLDAGRRAYTMRPLDVAAFVEELVLSFAQDLPPGAPEIKVHGGGRCRDCRSGRGVPESCHP